MVDARVMFASFFIILLVGVGFVLSVQPAPEISSQSYINNSEKTNVEKISNPTFIYDSEFVTTHVDARVFEVYSGHAWQQHGDEVNKAFRCLGDKGSSRSFKTFGFEDSVKGNIPTNVWLCFDGQDWYAIVSTAFEKVGGNYIARLITAYKVSKDLFPSIGDYVNYLIRNWSAREINYIIEAGTILVSPK